MVSLSPGDRWKQVPKDLPGNIAFRRHILKRCRDSRRHRLAIMEVCRNDILFCINTFAWQYNPRKVNMGEQRVGPFVTFPCQDEAILSMLDAVAVQEDLVIEKSREMGASWFSLMVMEWLWRSKRSMQFLMVSRNATLVDGHTPDSLFTKIDFLIDHYPEWLRDGYQDSKHRRKNFYTHPVTGSSITGCATTKDIGVGGRATAMFVDEYSMIDEAEAIFDMTADTTGCRIFNFTHQGTGVAAYDLSIKPGVRKLSLHWSMHPEKSRGLYRFVRSENNLEILDKSYHYPREFEFNTSGKPNGPYPGLRSPWYDAECRRRVLKGGGERGIAMNLDIDPQGAASQVFDSLIIRDIVHRYCRPPEWKGTMEFDATTGTPKELRMDSSGRLHLWCLLDVNGKPPPGRYCMGWDMSTGSGATPTCVSIIDALTHRKVGELADPFLRVEDAARLACALGWMFTDENGFEARMIWEHDGPGLRFGPEVMNLGYRNVYYNVDDSNPLQRKVSEKPGWYPNASSQRRAIESYQVALQRRYLENPSELAVKETLQFIYDDRGQPKHSGRGSKTTDPSGAGVNHGDRVVADYLAWVLCEEAGVEILEEKQAEIPYMSLLWRREQRKLRETEESWMRM